MDNNENKSKLIKSEHTLYKKSNSEIYPNLNLGDSINMGFKDIDVKKGLGLINRNSSNRYGNILSKSISEQNDTLGLKTVSNTNTNEMYKSMWSYTPKYDQTIERIRERADIKQQISLLPDSSWKRNLELGLKTNVISGLDVTPILRRNRNIINDEVQKALRNIEPLNNVELSINPRNITKGYYKNYSGFKYKDDEVYRKDILTEEYVNVNDIDIYEEISNSKSLDIGRKEMHSFIRFSKKFPMLLMEHEVGKKIYEYIQTLQPVKLTEELYLYRMRPYDDDDDRVIYAHDEMLKPPYDVSEGGRFDQYGDSVLYTTDSLEISMLETFSSSDTHKHYYLRKFKYDNSLKIADLTNENDWIEYVLMKKKSKQGAEYIVPRFVAQCLKHHGFEGFIVDSIHAKKDEKNYIFFDYKTNNFETIEDESYTAKEVEDCINDYKKDSK